MIFAFLLLLGQAASAYIPEYSLIASRAADQHGNGAYKIEQEVTYKREADSFTVKETWYVLNENNLRVTLEGRGPLRGLVSGTMIYDGNLKVHADADGLKSNRLGDEWLEPLFHFRNSKYFRSRLVNLKFAPSESLRDRPALDTQSDTPAYQAPSFIRLSRAGGSVDWLISAGLGPMLWMEQDQFVLRKFKTASNVTVRADDYAKYDGGFWYPRVRTYSFDPYTIQIRTLSVQSLGKLNNDPRFRSSSLHPKQDALKLPDTDGLREFYQRFR